MGQPPSEKAGFGGRDLPDNEAADSPSADEEIKKKEDPMEFGPPVNKRDETYDQRRHRNAEPCQSEKVHLVISMRKKY